MPAFYRGNFSSIDRCDRFGIIGRFGGSTVISQVPVIRYANDTRLYRKIPIVRRLVPSLRKHVERLIWPGGRTMRAVPLRLVGISAPAIHVFGDSHSWLYRHLPGAIVHFLISGVTMHRIGRDGLSIFKLDTLAIKPGEALAFIFGEVDVRAHIARQRDKFDRDPNEVIDTLVARYMLALSDVKKAYPLSPIVVVSVSPPMGDDYPNFNRYILDYPPGPEPDRIVWTVQMNRALRKRALELGFGYLDQYTPFVDERGLLNLSMTNDGLHLIPNPPSGDVQELRCEFSVVGQFELSGGTDF